MLGIKDSYNLPGVAVSITDIHSTLYSNYFGKINSSEQVLIGSCSKSFTALLILKLQEKGLLNINDPVVKYLNWFQYADKGVSDIITIKDLLHHASGIPSILGRITIEEDSTGSTQKEVELMLSELSLDSSQFEYQYSNINYRLLGYIVEEVTGSQYGANLKKEILQPLELNHTSGFVLDPERKGFPGSYNYFLYYPIIPYTSSYYRDQIPEGHIASNAHDMAIYLREHLKGYTNDSSKFIDQNLATSLFTTKNKTESGYGMGWFINKRQDQLVLYHTGLTEGFNTCMILDPETETAIFVAINSGVDTAFEIASGISNILAEKEPKSYSKTFFYMIRSIPLLVVALLIILVLQLKKWRAVNFRTGLSKNLKPNLLLILGILFGSLWVIIFPVMYQTTLKVIINHDPASGISLILIATLIVLICFVYYFKNQTRTHGNA
ncbi:serine hydrolase domain-containing protein [Lutimonas zeaxanthinifaciens]|uniref:serine hydrolase domain-containing protein n=1 Tax=Lutimonas zeaxanthinifaciens TaxID=3060215 RepID=UPI00265D0A28|nr:serine hydrolase domain-containing protein [Lutimonas sp. YSD2104]WKK67546.1 serine hydrolase domain-containing protein [Lutimonas sp. YSD2104]